MKNTKGFWYCYKNDEKAIFLNRWDQVIKSFSSFENAVAYANANLQLIDRPLN